MQYKGDDILRFIPQRPPFLMVDGFEQRSDQEAATVLFVRMDNYFMQTDRTMATTGLIEHIAQSCSALAAVRAHADKPPVGMIAEVRHFACQRLPRAGERLDTTVTFGFTFGQMTMAHGTTSIGQEQIATTDLKIFMQ